MAAFVLRELTPPWRVGKELEKQQVKIEALEKVGTSNQQQIDINKRDIARNREDIEKNQEDIEKNQEEIKTNRVNLDELSKGTGETARELRELLDKTIRDNGRLADEVMRLKKSSKAFEGRLSVIEQQLRIGPPTPEVVQ